MGRGSSTTRSHHGTWLRVGHAGCLICSLLAVLLVCTATAGAAVHPATVIDGPGNAILELDGAAQAPDGTGGVVYRKQVAGVTHVFAAQFVAGRWSSPLQVDIGDVYGASQPAIAAGDGGRLLVVWVQERNINYKGVAQYELMGAALEPGASAFGQTIVIDPSVGEPSTGDVGEVDPKLAMAPDGIAYVVYRVITNDCHGLSVPNSSCPPLTSTSTDKLVSVRVARYDYLLWSSLGAVNRAPQIAMRNPTAANAPAIGIDDLADNEGVVAWQEPSSDGVARIWMRRLFGVVQGNVLQVSPEALNGHAVTSDADAPAVAVNPEGEARIAFRIQGAPGSAVANTQLFLNALPSTVDFHGGQLSGASSIVGAAGGVGQPSVAIDGRGDFRVAWNQNGAARELAGSEESSGSPLQIGATESQIFTTINPAGGGTTAWVGVSSAGLPVVDVQEEDSQGDFQSARLAGNAPGAISGLSLGGDGQGDALLAWMQGPPGASEVVGAFVQAPPASFQVTTPIGWVGARGAQISWTPAPDAGAGVTYTVYIDGRLRLNGLTGLSTRLDAPALGGGVHRVQVLAVDAAGQRTLSAAGELKLDLSPPIVRLALIDHRRGVRVSVRDQDSGVDVGVTRIAFGDGRHSRGHRAVNHVYVRAGAYLVTAYVRDRVGNAATVRLRASVR